MTAPPVHRAQTIIPPPAYSCCCLLKRCCRNGMRITSASSLPTVRKRVRMALKTKGRTVWGKAYVRFQCSRMTSLCLICAAAGIRSSFQSRGYTAEKSRKRRRFPLCIGAAASMPTPRAGGAGFRCRLPTATTRGSFPPD